MDCEYSWIDALERGEIMPFRKLIELFNSAYQILGAESNIVEIDGNVTVVSCIRGNFRSLLHVLKIAGHPSKTRYLFIGGYIGREPLSLECLLLVLALKELYPHQITLIQGRERAYTDYVVHALESKYAQDETQQIMLGLSDIFTAMPLAALVNKKILCIHGGLTPRKEMKMHANKANRHIITDVVLLDELVAFDRFAPVNANEIDPIECLVSGYAEPDQEGWGLSNAGIGFTYGQDIFEKFMKDNNLEEMIAARIRSSEGSGYLFAGKLLELFSAADYAGINNKGAFVNIVVDADGKLRKNIVSYGPFLKE